MFVMISYMHITDMRRLGRPPATLLQRDLAEGHGLGLAELGENAEGRVEWLEGHEWRVES